MGILKMHSKTHFTQKGELSHYSQGLEFSIMCMTMREETIGVPKTHLYLDKRQLISSGDFVCLWEWVMDLFSPCAVNTNRLHRWHQCGQVIRILQCVAAGLSLPLAKAAVARTASGLRPLQTPPRASLSDTSLKWQLIVYSVYYTSVKRYLKTLSNCHFKLNQTGHAYLAKQI